MKNLVLIVVFLFALSSVAMASPLMDYSQGKASLDYMYRPSLDFDGKAGLNGLPEAAIFADGAAGNSFASGTLDGKANLDWGITYGIGNNWAIQYRGYNPETDNKTFISENEGPVVYQAPGEGDGVDFVPGVTVNGKINSEEFNVLYKLNKNVAAFAGVVRTNASINIDARGYYNDAPMGAKLTLKSDDNTTGQIGLVGVTKVWEKTNAYGVVSLGSDYRNWEAGLAYAIDPNVELNVSYRSTKYDDFAFGKIYDPVGSESINAGLKDVEVKGWGLGLTYKF